MDTTIVPAISEKDKAIIHRLYTKSPLHQDSFREMARYERIRPSTDINRFYSKCKKSGMQCTLLQVVDIFKDLERAGFGKFKIGTSQTSKPHRFLWAKLNIAAVGKEATQGETHASPVLIHKTPSATQGKAERMLFMYQSPTGERHRLVFDGVEQVQELIHSLQIMIKE